MAVRTSTGFAEAILGPNAFDILMQDGVIEVRSGTQPASADLGATGTLLGRITRDGGAWTAGLPDNGLRVYREGRAAIKEPSHVWTLTGIATGTAGWFRWLPNLADPGGVSTTAVRIDGAIAPLASEGDYQLFLPSVAITSSSEIDISDWWYALPPIGV